MDECKFTSYCQVGGLGRDDGSGECDGAFTWECAMRHAIDGGLLELCGVLR